MYYFKKGASVVGLTTGDLASRLNEPDWRIRYAIKRAGINPAGRAGHYGLYAEADIPRIAASLRGLGWIVRPSAESRVNHLPVTAEAR